MAKSKVRDKLNAGLKVRVERAKPSPGYPPSPLKKGARRVREELERGGQAVRNVTNTITEGVRKIRRHVGKG